MKLLVTVISVMVMTAVDAEPEPCFKPNTNYGGINVGHFPGMQHQPKECQTKCQDNRKCVVWTIFNGICYLKTDGSDPHPHNNPNVISGPKWCPVSKDEYRCKNGTIIPSIDVCDGVKNCKDGEDESRCTDKCLIKKTAYVKGKHIAGKWHRLTGNDDANRLQCLKMCRTTKWCMHWTYINRGRKLKPEQKRQRKFKLVIGKRMRCYLKRSDQLQESRDEFPWNKYATSGDRHCKSCFAADTNYPAANIHHPESVTNPQDCQKECQATTGCEFFSFYDKTSSSDYGCWLKNKKNTPTMLKDATSGPRSCAA